MHCILQGAHCLKSQALAKGGKSFISASGGMQGLQAQSSAQLTG